MGIEAPVVNAPMGGAAGGRLAAAVTGAGGLGMIGMGSAATAELLDRELRLVEGLNGPFGIGLVHWVMSDNPDLLDTALAARPALLSVSFGDGDFEWVQRTHDAGVRVATQVASVDAALRAVDAGVDVLVARGAEGGGHGRPVMGTLPLLVGVLDAVDGPVLAAGGIASARGLAAVLAAGASGAWIGTVFAACTEALTPDDARAELVAGSETELTSAYDIAAGYRWPADIPERVLRGSPVNAGQGVGVVRAQAGAVELVTELCEGAAALLGRWGSQAR
ncbi:MAG: nitronate monooxygenase [Mycobacterium sp.]